MGELKKFIWFVVRIIIGVIFDFWFFCQAGVNYLKDIPRNRSKRIGASFMLWFVILFFWFLDNFPELEKKFRPQIRVIYPDERRRA